MFYEMLEKYAVFAGFTEFGAASVFAIGSRPKLIERVGRAY